MRLEYRNESLRRMLALLAFLNLFARCAHAQQTGLWGGFGVAYGSFGCLGSFRCDAHQLGEAEGALGGFATLARTLTAHVSAGVELNAWVKGKRESTVRMGNASAVIFFRPTVRGGLRLKGSLGISVFENSGIIDGDIILSDRQVGGTAGLGIGYDLRLSTTMSVTPSFGLGRSTFVGGSFDEASNMWHVGLGLTWH